MPNTTSKVFIRASKGSFTSVFYRDCWEGLLKLQQANYNSNIIPWSTLNRYYATRNRLKKETTRLLIHELKKRYPIQTNKFGVKLNPVDAVTKGDDSSG